MEKNRSITANIALSYDALDAADQRRLRALAVFAPSGFAPRAVAAVWGESDADARRNLERLQDESLVMDAEKIGRLRLHDLVRDYAMLKLNECGETEAMNRAHAEFLIALFEENYNVKPDGIPIVGDELENLREAAQWAQEHREDELLARLATVPRNWLYNFFRAWDDWQAWLGAALRVGIDHDSRLKANVLQAMGDVQQFRDDRDAALQSYEQALGLYRQVGDKLGEANVLAAHARLLVANGNLPQAEQMLTQAITLRREIHSLYDEGVDYGNFALALLRVGERARAKTYALQAKAIFQRIGEPSLLEWVERLLAACG